jgi:hypothetical protein
MPPDAFPPQPATVLLWYIRCQGEDGQDFDLLVRALTEERAIELWKEYYFQDFDQEDGIPQIDKIGIVPSSNTEGAINWGEVFP